MTRYKVTSRTLNLRGGSYTVVIPSEFIEELGLKSGDQLVFVLDSKKKYALVGRNDRFGFTMTQLDDDEFELGTFRTELTDQDVMDIQKKNESK